MVHISLLLSDLDGTLFRDDKSVSSYTKDVVCAAQQRGVLFGISTSRALVNAVQFLDGIAPDVLITNGGGLANVRGRNVYACEFSLSETRALIQAARDILGSGAVLSVDNAQGFYSNSTEEFGGKYWTFTDFANFGQTAMKLCVQTSDRDAVVRIASRIGLGEVDFLPFSDIPWYKLSKKGATKENAVRAVCADLHIPLEQTAAFGDDFSDIGMLQLCGRGVAMANAIGEVKLAADELCGSNEEDGVARWIAAHILEEKEEA